MEAWSHGCQLYRAMIYGAGDEPVTGDGFQNRSRWQSAIDLYVLRLRARNVPNRRRL